MQPANYNYNLAFTNVAPLHAAGKFGQNIVVGVIDSGTANVSDIPALAGSIIGGETLVPATEDPLSATVIVPWDPFSRSSGLTVAPGGFRPVIAAVSPA